MQITVTSLNETFQKIRKDLIMLPSVYLGDELRRAGVAMIPGIQDEYKRYNYLRHTVNLMPYKESREYTSTAIGEIQKRILKVRLVNMYAQDNIQQYTHTDAGNFSLLGTNKTYKNPAERLIGFSVMKGISEAIMDAIFFMEYDENGTGKMKMNDGFLKLITDATTSKEIDETKYNLIKIGAITAPTTKDDTEAYDKAKLFLSSVNPTLLRGNNTVVNCTVETAVAIQDAMSNAKRYFKEPDAYGTFRLPEYPTVRWNPCLPMGKGSKLICTKDGNALYGFDSQSDDEYMLARQLNKDPNIIDYWTQFRIGVQYQSFNSKVFATTDGTLEAPDWEGDFQTKTVSASEQEQTA